MRMIDRVGIGGLLMVLVGGALFLSGRGPLPVWANWLFGPLLWYFGFALMVVWGMYRVFGFGREDAEVEEIETQQVEVKNFPSNFLEHDAEGAA